MTLRVDHGELEETDPHGEGLWLLTWKGEFFTGVAFTLSGVIVGRVARNGQN